MQFVADGPDVPPQLLRSLEAGRLVFFCGAGISCSAGLPAFKQLAKQIYQKLRTHPENDEQSYINRGEFDFALGALERRLPQPEKMRRVIAQILHYRGRRKSKPLSLHEALLLLSTRQDGTLQLVTTNYDRCFQIAASRMKRKFYEFAAPLIPIPKPGRWNGLVFLHGLLYSSNRDENLSNLIVTSGDFGRSYLTERWASRFVSELFRNYDICFVGYSLSDPVMRYAVDAMAAERAQIGRDRRVWAFASYETGKAEAVKHQWKGKGVEPVLYCADHQNHSLLNQTFSVWAARFNDGLMDSTSIVAQLATTVPRTVADEDVKHMLWALADPSGSAARRLADFEPLPPWEWVLVVTDPLQCREALCRLGIDELQLYPKGDRSRAPTFSLLDRPQINSRWHSSVFGTHVEWDEPMVAMASWLMRYLDDPRMLSWLATHPKLADNIISNLEKNIGTTVEKVQAKLENRKNSVSYELWRLWQLFLKRRICTGEPKSIVYMNAPVFDPTISFLYIQEIRRFFSPQLSIPNYKYINKEEVSSLLNRSEVVLVDSKVSVSQLNIDLLNRNQLLALVTVAEQLLTDAIEMYGLIGRKEINAVTLMPSITPHPQNKTFAKWTSLIEIVRDAWLKLCIVDPAVARQEAERWFSKESAIFVRLSLFAASQSNGIPCSEWIEWLLRNDAKCLWHATYKREVCRLLALRGNEVTEEERGLLEQAILLEDKTNARAEQSIALRLRRLQQSSGVLGKNAQKWVNQHRKAWTQVEDEKAEFSAWFDIHWIDIETEAEKNIPKTESMEEWLKWLQSDQAVVEDAWEVFCNRNNEKAIEILIRCSKNNQWLDRRWCSALSSIPTKDAYVRWRKLAPIIELMPINVFSSLCNSILSWLADVAEEISLLSADEELLWKLWKRAFEILNRDQNELLNKDDDRLNWAINRPEQKLADILVTLSFRVVKNSENQLPSEYLQRLSDICQSSMLKAGQVWLAVHTAFFYQKNAVWTREYLLPLFDWNRSADDAAGMWQGFLSSSQNYPPLLKDVKPFFIETARHYKNLYEEGNSFVFFATFLAVMGCVGYKTSDFRQLFSALPKESLPIVIEALTQGMTLDSNKTIRFWKNRIVPFWVDIWPGNRENVTTELSRKLALLALTSEEIFIQAVKLFQDWFIPVGADYEIKGKIEKSDWIKKYPLENQFLLDKLQL